jgi:hypothetical protein
MIASLANKNEIKFLKLIHRRFFSKKIEKRNPNFAILNDKDISFFEKLLTNTRCITDPQLLDTYNNDWLRIVKGNRNS